MFSCYVLNRALIKCILKKTPYEFYKGRKPNISHFKVFGCKCFVLNNERGNLGKFDVKADEGILLGYSSRSLAYRVYNKRTMTVEDFVHIAFDEASFELQYVYKNNENEEESIELLQGNNRLIQKFN